MKRRNCTRKNTYKCPALFRGDLERLERIILQDLKPANYEVFTDEDIATSVKAFDESYESKELILEAKDPGFRIELSGEDAIVIWNSGDTLAGGVSLEVGKILRKCERPWLYFVMNYASSFAMSLIMTSCIVGVSKFGVIRLAVSWKVIIPTFLLGIILAVFCWYYMDKYSHISFSGRPDTGRQIIIGVIVVLISTAILALPAVVAPYLTWLDS